MWEEFNMSASGEGTLWYALHVRIRFEEIVARSLRDKGYEEFLPRYRPSSRWPEHFKDIELPLFPRYVFCRFNALDRLPVLTTPGVTAIVGFGRNLIPIDESI